METERPLSVEFSDKLWLTSVLMRVNESIKSDTFLKSVDMIYAEWEEGGG